MVLPIPVFSFRRPPLCHLVPLEFKWGQFYPLALETGTCPRMDTETPSGDFCSNPEEGSIRCLWELPSWELLMAILFCT